MTGPFLSLDDSKNDSQVTLHWLNIFFSVEIFINISKQETKKEIVELKKTIGELKELVQTLIKNSPKGKLFLRTVQL